MNKRPFLTIRELVLFGLFPSIIYGAQLATAALPNIHLTGMFLVLMTLLFRGKALIPLYLYVFIVGIVNGFNPWWVPYLYIWTVLWAMTMLIPRKIPDRTAKILYPLVCSLHGFLYGVLYSPAQAFLFGLNLKQTLTWIINGIPFDFVHGISNFCMGLLIFPLLKVLRRFTEKT